MVDVKIYVSAMSLTSIIRYEEKERRKREGREREERRVPREDAYQLFVCKSLYNVLLSGKHGGAMSHKWLYFTSIRNRNGHQDTFTFLAWDRC